MNKFFILLILSWFCSHTIFSQPVQTEKIEMQELVNFQQYLQGNIQKVIPASVLVTTHEQLTPTGGVSASGVCVSKEGIIMTAGHLTIPGGKYQITFPDGRNVNAIGLGKISNLDAGLLKITEEGIYPFAEIGNSASLKIGETCFSIAYPGSFASKKIVRLGQIKNISDNPDGDIRSRNIQTTCLMEPGDSGGPVFDTDGKVIGIRSYIGKALDENYDVPVDTYVKYWDILLKMTEYKGIPAYVSSSTSLKFRYYLWNDWFTVIQSTSEKYKKTVVEILSDIEGRPKKAVGTIVKLDDFLNKQKVNIYTFIISKSSEIGNHPNVFFINKTKSAKVIYRDVERDLVLLQVDGKLEGAVGVKVDATIKQSANFGKFLLSPLPWNAVKLSVWSSDYINLPAVNNTGYLGLRIELRYDKNVVTTIQPHTAAAEAGLKIGDEILSIDTMEIDVPETFIKVLKQKKVGEMVCLVRKTNGLLDTLNVKLKAKPTPINTHIAEQFTDGKSERRHGFSDIFIHDATIKPAECGGPVLDIYGNFIGINMARYSRVSSVVMPAKNVMEFLKISSALLK